MNRGNQIIYKIIKDLDKNLNLYRNIAIYDENPDLGTYCSTLYVPHPKKGDYLICTNRDITFSSVYRDFDDIYFSKKINLVDLLKKQIIREISTEIYELDFILNKNIKEISENINTFEFGLDLIKDDIKNTEYSKKNLINLKSTLYILKSIQDDLYNKSKDQVLEKVIIKGCLKFIQRIKNL